MNNRNTALHHITRRIRLIACISALGTAFMIALPQVGHAQNVTPPAVPGTLHVPEGNEGANDVSFAPFFLARISGS